MRMERTILSSESEQRIVEDNLDKRFAYGSGVQRLTEFVTKIPDDYHR